MPSGQTCLALCLWFACQSSHGQNARFSLTKVHVSQAAAVLQDFTGQPVVLASDVTGSITLSSSKPLDRREALDLFAAALKAQGLMLHPTGDEIRVTRAPSFSPRRARESDAVHETRIFTLQHLGVAEVSPAVRALLSPHGTISAKNSNTLIVSDKYTELLKITRYMMAADSAKDRPSTQSECARLQDAAGLLLQHFSAGSSRTGLDSAPDERWVRQLHGLNQALENGAGCENNAPSAKALEHSPVRAGGPELLNQTSRRIRQETLTDGTFVPQMKSAVLPGPLQDVTVSSDDATSRELGFALEGWRLAWSRRDLSAYLEFYDPHFLPAGESTRDDWKKKRRAAFARAAEVTIDVADLSINLAGVNQATMVFTQTYRSKHYRDVATKTLQWVYVEGRWLIARESAVKARSGAERG